MKIIRYTLYLLALSIGVSCSVPSNDSTSKVIKVTPNNREEMQNETLILNGTANYRLAMGYGAIFDLEVKKIIEGNLNDSVLSLVIIEEKYRVMLLNSENKDFNFHFLKVEENYQENRMFESGTVDSNKTAWKLTGIE